ncbi:MAG: response regulator [Rhodospirillaceae bacterium]|jgi:two-component system, chemotaxis family, chemotaxis protein CheY|nr:response regulator [Rhodospirillaceae bacterium]MBT5374066.1 response regulator [Rhodospirillaceae bacterium]MBT5660020.1 response regulator [Rhodospirillaceae bacterium]MBT5751503.1 response regulator [Rhodospirillaceae bacterium]
MDKSFYSSLKVLVIDDDEMIVRILETFLTSLGIEKIASAPDGSEGLSTLKREGADIIICDWMMMPQNGLEFCRSVRADADETIRRTPILMVTANHNTEQQRQAIEAGANDILAKPILPKEIALRINTLLSPGPA